MIGRNIALLDGYEKVRLLSSFFSPNKVSCVFPQGLPSLLISHYLTTAQSVVYPNMLFGSPSHQLPVDAVYFASSSPSSSSATEKTRVPHPITPTRVQRHFANLSALPSLQPSLSDMERYLLIVPFCLLVPAAFPLLHSYLYAGRADILLGVPEPEQKSDTASTPLSKPTVISNNRPAPSSTIAYPLPSQDQRYIKQTSRSQV